MRLFLLRHVLFLLVLLQVASCIHADAVSWGIGNSNEGDAAVPPASPEPTTEATLKPSRATPAATPPPVSAGAGASTPTTSEPLEARKPARAEVYGALCLAYFVFNYFKGKMKNESHARVVSERLRPMLESQFSHLGPGPIVVDADQTGPTDGDGADKDDKPILLRESANEFVIWASGRRNLGSPGQGSGALLRLRLRPRQDAVSNVLAVAEGLPDQLEVTLPLPRRGVGGGSAGVGGGSAGGVPVALAVGRPAALREAYEDYEDLRRLTRAVACNGAPVRGLPWWPTASASVGPGAASSSSPSSASSGGLAAVSDSPQAFADLIASGPMGAALAASARASLGSSSSRIVSSRPKPRLRILRLNGDGALRKGGAAGAPVLSAVFDLPSPGERGFEAAADDVVQLVEALLETADAVAAYGGSGGGGKVMSSEARSKALALRASAASAAAAGDGDDKGGSSSSVASLEAKRAAAREAEKQKLASMSNEAKEKYLLRKHRIEQKRLMKKRTMRA